MNKTWNVRGRLVDLSSPLVMGVINLTPDSFHEGSRHIEISDALRHAEEMVAEGADIVDVGGYSSRPGASDITEEEELRRTIPVIRAMTKQFPELLVSVDTFRSEVAARALDAGASILNDISGGSLNNDAIAVLCASNRVPYIAMHMRGTPQTMNSLTHYEDLLKDIVDYFQARLQKFSHLGVTDVVVDPGFGFAKTVDQNFTLLKNLPVLKILGRPILAGLSRKSMIWRTLETTPAESLNGTTALNMAALMNGASVLRVHDVKEARECVKLWTKMS